MQLNSYGNRVITPSTNTDVELKSRFPQSSITAFYQGTTNSNQVDHSFK